MILTTYLDESGTHAESPIKRGRKPARDPKDTIRKLSEMTDEAELEHLATAIRREATPNILSGSIRGQRGGQKPSGLRLTTSASCRALITSRRT
jgi:hypothetical protein